MKLMKSKATHLRLSSDGALSMSEFESTALNMISGEVSIVETSKKVDIEEILWNHPLVTFFETWSLVKSFVLIAAGNSTWKYLKANDSEDEVKEDRNHEYI